MSSDILPVLQGIAEIVAVVIFLFAAFRAVTIGRALVNRVHQNRAYVTAIFAIIAVAGQLVPSSWVVVIPIYNFFFAIIFVLVDTTILVSLDTDFFHRNTLRWRQVRLVAYLIIVAIEIGAFVTNYLPNFLYTLVGEIYLAAVIALGTFVSVYSTLTAIVSARRSSDIPLRRFMEYTGILLLLYLVNTLIYVLVTEAIAPFLLIVFGYVTYQMAMSLSPVGKIQKGVEATTPSQGSRHP
jgi:hypothetical protein